MQVTYEVYGVDVTHYFECSNFPAGEEFVRFNYDNSIFPPASFIDIIGKDVFFIEKYKKNTDVCMRIGQKVNILRRLDCNKISVVLPYLPYSRQDRYTTEIDSFALKVFADYLNSLNLHRVYTVDAHSDVSGVINNLFDLLITPVLIEVFKKENRKLNILSPDAGAIKKLYKNINNVDGINEIITAEKIRDVKTGDITGLNINGDFKNKQFPTLIIDDLCDGGRTFTSLSELMKGDKILYVTHGVFSKVDVFKSFRSVYTTDSYDSGLRTENVIELNFEEYLSPARRGGFSS